MKLFFITLLLTMTLSGSLAFILYLLIMFILHEKVPASFRYTILKFCFFLFIVPVPLVKHIFVIWLLSPPKHEVISGFLINTAQTFNLTDGGILFPSFTHFEKLFCIIWFLIIGKKQTFKNVQITRNCFYINIFIIIFLHIIF